MAGSHRSIPKRLAQFNYWTRARIRPASALEISFEQSYGSKYRLEQVAERFQKHRHGPCGIRGCGTDELYRKEAPEDWERLALEELAATDSGWNNVEGAQSIYRSLDATARRRIDSLWGSRRTKWRTLLRNIARDQQAYDQITKARPRDKELYVVADRFRLTESWARRVYAKYSAQASVLRGDGVLVPDSEQRRVWKERLGQKDGDRRVKTVSQIPKELTEGKNPKERRAIEDRWIEHWFAHALRNLVRYRDKRDPLPWRAGCRAECIGDRNRRAEDH